MSVMASVWLRTPGDRGSRRYLSVQVGVGPAGHPPEEKGIADDRCPLFARSRRRTALFPPSHRRSVALVTGGLLLAGIAAAVLGPLLAALLIRRNDAGPTDAGATVALALTILAVSVAAVSAVAMFVLAWRRTVRTPHGRHRKGRAS